MKIKKMINFLLVCSLGFLIFACDNQPIKNSVETPATTSLSTEIPMTKEEEKAEHDRRYKIIPRKEVVKDESGTYFGNSNANIANGGYMVEAVTPNSTAAFYHYYNSSRNNSVDSYSLWCEAGDYKNSKSLITAYNCKNLNNYKDEWIYYQKDNDGYIYRVKTDGTGESKL